MFAQRSHCPLGHTGQCAAFRFRAKHPQRRVGWFIG